MTAFALMLVCAAAASWMMADGALARSRPYLRFAVVAYFAMAASAAVHLTESVALVVSPCAVGALALAALQRFRRAPSASVSAAALGIAALCGISAAVSGVYGLAFAPLLAAIGMLFALGIAMLRVAPQAAVHLLVSALAFLAGASSMLQSDAHVDWPLLAFSSVGLLGSAIAQTSNPHVEAAR